MQFNSRALTLCDQGPRLDSYALKKKKQTKKLELNFKNHFKIATYWGPERWLGGWVIAAFAEDLGSGPSIHNEVHNLTDT